MNFVEVGFVRKTHGVDGAVKVVVEDEYWEDVVQAEVFLLEQKGQPIPYFVESKRSAGDLLIVQFEDVDSPEAAQQLVKAKLFLRESDILPEEERQLEVEEVYTFNYLKGFLLSDKEQGEIGKILEVIELPQQEFALIEYAGQERMIPLHEQLILEINEGEKTVLLDLPEGLLDL